MLHVTQYSSELASPIGHLQTLQLDRATHVAAARHCLLVQTSRHDQRLRGTALGGYSAYRSLQAPQLEMIAPPASSTSSRRSSCKPRTPSSSTIVNAVVVGIVFLCSRLLMRSNKLY